MRGRIKKWGPGFLVGLSLWGGSALAQSSLASPIDFQGIQSGGNGCRGGGAVDLYRAEQSGRVMIFFSDLGIDVEGKKIERKACAVSIPLDLPEGKRLVISTPALFGASLLSEGVAAKAHLEVFVVGEKGLEVGQSLSHEETSKFFYQRSTEELRSACGAQTLIRVNASLLGQGNGRLEGRALLEGIAVTLKIENCE